MLDRVSDVGEARDLATVVSYLRTRVTDVPAYERALRLLGRGGDVREFLHRWLTRVRFPASPIASAGGHTTIDDGVALRRAALEFRNCSIRFAIDLLEGRAAMATFGGPSGSAMIHLQRREGDWRIGGIYGPANQEIGENTRAEVLLLLRRFGIAETRFSNAKANPYESLRRLSPRGMWV